MFHCQCSSFRLFIVKETSSVCRHVLPRHRPTSADSLATSRCPCRSFLPSIVMRCVNCLFEHLPRWVLVSMTRGRWRLRVCVFVCVIDGHGEKILPWSSFYKTPERRQNTGAGWELGGWSGDGRRCHGNYSISTGAAGDVTSPIDVFLCSFLLVSFYTHTNTHIATCLFVRRGEVETLHMTRRWDKRATLLAYDQNEMMLSNLSKTKKSRLLFLFCSEHRCP